MHHNKLSLVESPLPSALTVAPLTPTIGLVKPKRTVLANDPSIAESNRQANPSQDKPAESKLVVAAKAKARNRSTKLNTKTYGKLRADQDYASTKEENEERLLDDLTRFTREAVTASFNLIDCLKKCCEAVIGRDEVIQAVIAGGWSENRARTAVSEVWRSYGFHERNMNGGTPRKNATPAIAVDIAQSAIERCGDKAAALKMINAACNYLRKQVKTEAESAKRANSIAAAKLGNGGKLPTAKK